MTDQNETDPTGTDPTGNDPTGNDPIGNEIIAQLSRDDCRDAARYLPQWGTPGFRAARTVDLASDHVVNKAAEQIYQNSATGDESTLQARTQTAQTLLAGALEPYRNGVIAAIEQFLGPHGRGWNESGPMPLHDAYGVAYSAVRQLAMDALSGPDASSLLPQGLVDRLNARQAAREGRL